MSDLRDESMRMLADRWFDEPLTADESAALAAWLAADEANLRYLADRGAMSAAMRHIARRLAGGAVEATASPTFRITVRSAFALAAGLLIAIGVGAAIYASLAVGTDESKGMSPVAVVTDADDVAWLSEPVAAGATITALPMRIASGVLRVESLGGASVTVIGPAEVTFESRSTVRLTRGRATAHVPQAAVGFAVATPAFRVVDLGTDFGVAVDEDGGGQVHVFDGVIEVHAGGSVTLLTADEARAVSASGIVSLVTADRRRFKVTSDVIAADEFDGALDGGVGFADAWTTLAGQAAIESGRLTVRGDGTSRHAIQRTLTDAAAASPGRTIYFAATMRFDGTDTTRSVWLCVGRRGAVGNARRSAIVGFWEHAFACQLADAAGMMHAANVGEPKPGREYRLVGRLQFDADGGADERLTLWVDRASEFDTPLATATADIGIDSIHDVIIETWEMDAAHSATIKDLRIGTTWRSVAPAAADDATTIDTQGDTL